MDHAEAAHALGMKASEITDVTDSEAGTIVHVFDGTQLIVVPEDTPDADGKTGVMFFTGPTAGDKGYQGDFPVYAQPQADAALDTGEAGDEYPKKGSADAVLSWVAGDEERAREAYDAELKAKKPRSGLVDELTNILAQYPALDAGEAGDETSDGTGA